MTPLFVWATLLTATRAAAAFSPPHSTTTTTFLNSKRSDRAHIERNLEDMMDNDWRVFRARLVAQEHAEQQQQEEESSQDHRWSETEKQDKLGDLFAGAISSIFNKNKISDKTTSTTTSTNHHHHHRHDDTSSNNIFQGDSVGGALPEDLVHQDPFVSEAELPLWLKPGATIDKHRWAHEISHIEPGCVLIANEKLGGVFHQTVVLVVEHHENAGSTGVIINRYVRDPSMHQLFIFATITTHAFSL